MTDRSLAKQLNEMEYAYFFDRRTGEASARGYIDGKTWRGWRASPKEEGAVKEALIAAFDFLTPRFESFLKDTHALTRSQFDAFHDHEIEALHHYARSYHRSVEVGPAAKGECHGHAYNSYAKVLNLAHTHWCFRPDPRLKRIRYDPSRNPRLLQCVHVPLDTKVCKGIRRLLSEGLLPSCSVRIPSDGMGSIRSREHYQEVQNYLRAIVDKVTSTNFSNSTVSPLAFEAFWGK